MHKNIFNIKIYVKENKRTHKIRIRYQIHQLKKFPQSGHFLDFKIKENKNLHTNIQGVK